MAFQARLQKLVRQAPEGPWCGCRVEHVVVRYPGDPGPAAPLSSQGAAGRTVCGTCGLPRKLEIPQIVIIMPRAEGEALSP